MNERPPQTRGKLGLNKPIPVVPLPADPDLAPISMAPGPAAGTPDTQPRTSHTPADACCPDCERHFPADAVICVYCAYDRRKGLSAGALARKRARAPAPLLCPKCQYSLVGLTTQICPECGERFSLARAGRIINRQANETYQKRIWIAPSVMLGIGLMVFAYALWRIGDVYTAAAASVATTISLLGAIAGYITAAVLLTGWHYAIHHALYRITAVLILLTALQLLTTGLLFSIIAWIIAIVALYFLLITFLDTDAKDAGLVVACMIAGNVLGTFCGMYAVYLIFN